MKIGNHRRLLQSNQLYRIKQFHKAIKQRFGMTMVEAENLLKINYHE